MCRVGIVAALEREVLPLVTKWRVCEKEHAGRRFRFYESADVVLVCGGIGPEAARRAAEAVIAIFSPTVVYSVGFAGALDATAKVGDVVQPSEVIDARDGSRGNLNEGRGVLVSFVSVASPEQKSKLRNAFGAQFVDMEAAAVARAAQAREIEFRAVKAISDECDFAFPKMERFVDVNGRFSEARFALYAAVRPWLWGRVLRLAGDSRRASRALCARLEKLSSSAVASEAVRGSL